MTLVYGLFYGHVNLEGKVQKVQVGEEKERQNPYYGFPDLKFRSGSWPKGFP